MTRFYGEVLGFRVKEDLGEYVELHSEGVRLAICSAGIMRRATGDKSYDVRPAGQRFELAFPAGSPEDVDASYAKAVDAGAIPVRPPADMPWGQRAAFFADPDGNIHEFFAPLEPDT
jgi:catechol 2,3-dioxygenase-like lactoylglutathione lyase family enzyme